MFAFISGRVVSITDTSITLENNGIGFELFVSSNTLAYAGIVGKSLQLYTYLNVKDDTFIMYGFSSKEEKSLFLKLITISGVGPKTALQMLSGLDINSLVLAIITGDVKTLSKTKGIGKKTAERIVLELRGQLGDFSESNVVINDGVLVNDSVVNDAVMALVALGINKTEAYKAVVKAKEKTDNLEEVITIALRGYDFRG